MNEIINDLDSRVAKAENGKLQTHIGNVRECRRLIFEDVARNPQALHAALKNAERSLGPDKVDPVIPEVIGLLEQYMS